jgi:tetraacyldisaccharide 4'-kinase
VRRAPAFWWREERSIAAWLLTPIGALVGHIAARRMRRRGWTAGVPVICIGNFVAGGAGKTPAAIAVAQHLIAIGETPFFLSRGYGARAPGAALLVDPRQHSADDVGDEPLLLSRTAPAIVARDRRQGAALARAGGASVIVMDDGLQSRTIEPDMALAVVDGEVGIGNRCCLPAGPLRAPFAEQLRHVHAVLVIGRGAAGESVAARSRQAGLPVLEGELVPDAAAVARLAARPVLAFAGIGRPEKFFATLRRAGIQVAETVAFADHQRFSPSVIDDLRQRARAQGSTLVTTEKDAVRLPSGSSVDVLPVRLEIEGAADWAQAIVGKLQLARSHSNPERPS